MVKITRSVRKIPEIWDLCRGGISAFMWEWKWRQDALRKILRNISTASKCCADRKEMLKLCLFFLALRLARIILYAVKSRQGLWQPFQGYPSQEQQGKSCLLSPGLLGGRGRKQGRKKLNSEVAQEEAVEGQSKSSQHRSGPSARAACGFQYKLLLRTRSKVINNQQN